MTSINSALREINLAEALRDSRARDIAYALAAGQPVDHIRVELFAESAEAVHEANQLLITSLAESKERRHDCDSN